MQIVIESMLQNSADMVCAPVDIFFSKCKGSEINGKKKKNRKTQVKQGNLVKLSAEEIAFCQRMAIN